MRLCLFYLSEKDRDSDLELRRPRAAHMGLVLGDEIVPVLVPGGSPIVGLDLGDYLEATGGDVVAEPPTSDERHKLSDVFLAPPVLRPRAFLDFYTFEQHVKTCRAKRGLDVVPEWYDIPAYYNGNASAFYGHGQWVPFPEGEEKLDYELELACIIGKTCRGVSEKDAQQVIAGYTILNDWSARTLQMDFMKIGLGPARGKDHATSIGPWLVTWNDLNDVRDLNMRAYVSGELWSEGNSGDSHYTFPQMISYASRTRTLYPGDIIASGTVGTGCGLELDKFLKPGDRVRLEIEGLGELENEIYIEGD